MEARQMIQGIWHVRVEYLVSDYSAKDRYHYLTG
jgi:hypothetical protein